MSAFAVVLAVLFVGWEYACWSASLAGVPHGRSIVSTLVGNVLFFGALITGIAGVFV